MCSYQRVNQTFACENSKTINGILKGELDYQGFVVSDCEYSRPPRIDAGLTELGRVGAAAVSGVNSALAGLDMNMASRLVCAVDPIADFVSTAWILRVRKPESRQPCALQRLLLVSFVLIGVSSH